MKRYYRLIAHYIDGGTECFGDFETEDAAIDRSNKLSNISNDLTEFELKIIIKK